MLFIAGCTNPFINHKHVDISDPSNTLTGKQETLQLSYIAWGCDCANWITDADAKKYHNLEGDALAAHCIFLEPASKDLALPPNVDALRNDIIVTGQFYVKPDYPKGTFQGEEHLDKARVFRYTKLKVKRRP